jgi:hypothetical protein
MSSKPLSSAPLEANDTGRTNQLFLGCSGPATPQADTKRRAAKSHKRVGREMAVRIERYTLSLVSEVLTGSAA